jgi:hypothetical protein
MKPEGGHCRNDLDGGLAAMSTGNEPTPYAWPLRWWQVLIFILPTLATVGTTGVLNALGQAKFEALAHPESSDLYWQQHMGLYNGLAGIQAGAVCCLVCGILICLTKKPAHPLRACIGWTLWCLLFNTGLSFAGCAIVNADL